MIIFVLIFECLQVTFKKSCSFKEIWKLKEVLWCIWHFKAFTLHLLCGRNHAKLTAFYSGRKVYIPFLDCKALRRTLRNADMFKCDKFISVKLNVNYCTKSWKMKMCKLLNCSFISKRSKLRKDWFHDWLKWCEISDWLLRSGVVPVHQSLS